MANNKEKPKTLQELLPADMFIGTSLILPEGEPAGKNRFLYGMRPVKEEGPRLVLDVTGIGGGLEPTDSSPGAGAIREAREEIGCDVTLVPSSMTLIVSGYDNVSLIEVAGPEKPLAIIYRHHKSPPHSPWHPYNKGLACLVLFLGELKGQPRPDKELPNLIWLPANWVLETARRDVPLGELLMAGAALIPGRPGSPPLDGLARMTDSQEALALALGSELPAFYEGVFQDDFPEELLTLSLGQGAETANRQESGSGVAFPAEFAEVIVEQSGSGEVNSALDPDKQTDRTTLEEELVASRATLDLLRQEIGEAVAKIEQLIERTEKVGNEIDMLKKTIAGSRNQTNRPRL